MCNGTRDGWRAGGGKISSQKQRELVNVTKIYSNNDVFVVLRSDGTFRAWGNAYSTPCTIDCCFCMACLVMAGYRGRVHHRQ